MHFLLALWLVAIVQSLYLDGSYTGEKDQWEILGKFCFNTQGGSLRIRVNASDAYINQRILFYHDANGIEDLYESDNSCVFKENQASDYLTLTHDRVIDYTISSARPRWWYFAISNCEEEEIHIPYYEVTMMNNDSHVSFDEAGIHLCAIVLVICYFIGAPIMGWATYISQNNNDRKTGSVYLGLTVAMVLEIIALVVEIVDRNAYETNGLHNAGLQEAALILSLLPQIVLVGIFVCVSKGWNISSSEIQDRDTVIEIVGLYFISTAGMYWYEYANPPPFVSSEYLFESGAGLLIAGIRITMMVWFIGTVYKSWYAADPMSPTREFYKGFGIYASAWFISLPVVVFLSLGLDSWNRKKLVTCFSWILDFVFYFILAYAFRPSAKYVFQISEQAHRMGGAMKEAEDPDDI